MMSYSSQPPSEFPEFSTQMTLGRMTGVDEDIPNNEDSTSTRRKIPKWTTKQNLVQVGGKTGSGSSGSKRAHNTNASDSNSV
ncbi:hypothetical protein AtEden1_Chr3g0190791 [Arabidopsis thaliana]